MKYASIIELDSFKTDAFSNSYKHDFFYAFPQFSITQNVLRKTENKQAEEIIFFLFFTTQAWFTGLLRILVSEKLTLPKS